MEWKSKMELSRSRKKVRKTISTSLSSSKFLKTDESLDFISFRYYFIKFGSLYRNKWKFLA